jgi:hypothetical protein
MNTASGLPLASLMSPGVTSTISGPKRYRSGCVGEPKSPQRILICVMPDCSPISGGLPAQLRLRLSACRLARRILHHEPVRRSSRDVARVLALRHDAFKAERLRVLQHGCAMKSPPSIHSLNTSPGRRRSEPWAFTDGALVERGSRKLAQRLRDS